MSSIKLALIRGIRHNTEDVDLWSKKGDGTLHLKTACYILTLFVLLGCQPSFEQDSLQRVLDRGVLKVGTSYGLTTYFNEATGPAGFEYEMAAGFAEYLGVELEVLPYYNTKELLPQLANSHVDIIAAGLTRKAAQQAEFRVGPGYQNVSQKLVFKQGGIRPRKLEDLSSSIGVVADSNHAHTLALKKQTNPTLEWYETEDKDSQELLEMVLAGELDYTIADSNFLALMRRRHPELSVGFTLQKSQDIAWALSKNADDSLLASLIEYFGKIKLDGTLAALEDKYFGHVKKFDYVDTREFIKAVKKTLPTFKGLFQTYSGDLDWRLLAAMSYQESHWRPKAKSPTGVRGMMMLTLGTAKDMGIKSRLDPKQSIQGGARYFSNLLRRIPARIKAPDRIWFAMAAYNVGLGHLEDARVITERLGSNPDMWVDVKKHLPLLRQKKYYKTTRYGYARGNEAVNYVANIRRYYDTLVWLDEQKTQELESAQESLAQTE